MIIQCGKSVFWLRKPAYRRIPGWHYYVKSEYSVYRDRIITWRESNSPRHGPLATSMCLLRAGFKLSLSFSKANETRMKSDAIARKLPCKNRKNIWKDNRFMNLRMLCTETKKNSMLQNNEKNTRTGSNVCKIQVQPYS